MLLSIAVVTVGVKIGLMVLGIGLSFLAGKLLADKARKAIISDDKPTTLSQRGSYVPLLVGRRRIGSIFAWAGDRITKKETISGGKGGKGGGGGFFGGPKQKQKIYFENGWHILCVGPANKIHRIWQHGEIIFGTEFEEALNPTTHPSGTTVDFGGEGQMTVFWGEKLQPINTDLGDANRVSISSRWPFMCYVYWEVKRLGTSPIWPLIEYEVEVRPKNVNISATPNWVEPERGTIWTGLVTDKAYKNRDFTTTIIKSFAVPGTTRGITTIENQTDDVLTLDAASDIIDRHDGFSSTILSSITVSSIEAGPTDCTVGNDPVTVSIQNAPQNVYFTGVIEEKLFQLVGFSTTVGSSFSTSSIGLNPGSITMWQQILWDGPPFVAGTLPVADICFRAQTPNDAFRLTGFSSTVKTTVDHSGVVGSSSGMSNDGPKDHILFSESSSPSTLLQFASFTTTINATVDINSTDTVPTGIAHESNLERIQPYLISKFVEGANAAHSTDQLLFEKYPHGIGIDVADFDLPSLESVGTDLDFPGEDIPTHLVLLEGEKFQSGMASLMQDIGMFISWDVETEKYVFKLIRSPTGLLPAITPDLLVNKLPERTIVHDDLAADRIIFAFSDRDRNYRDTTLTLNDDGQAELVGVTKARSVRLTTITDFSTAQKVTERRAQEEMVAPAKFKIKTARAFRKLVPGDAFTLDGVAQVLRLLGVGLDTESDEVILESIIDSYGLSVSTVKQNPGAGLVPPVSVNFLDKQFTFYEVNKYLAEGKISIFVPRIRDSLAVIQAAINISRNGTSFINVQAQDSIYAGGTLKDSIALLTPAIIDTGPEVNILGPDTSSIQDLTGDDFSWKAGRQICIINDELFFLQKAVSISSTVIRLDGLVRARLATSKAVHGIGAEVYILDQSELEAIEDVLIVPSVTLFVKSQPQAEFLADLADITAVSKALKGDGLRGLPVENINSDIGDRTWAAGTDLDIVWSFRSSIEPRTGAGQQGAGEATTVGTVQGTFTVKIRDAAFVLVNTFKGLTTNAFTYTNAQMVADFSGEPLSLNVEVINVDNGLDSDLRIVLMEKN